MTFNHLAAIYPNVRYEISNGQKRIARIIMEYDIVGSPDSIAKFLDVLDQEWPFAQQRCEGTAEGHALHIQVEYLVKPNEFEAFIKKVPHRERSSQRTPA